MLKNKTKNYVKLKICRRKKFDAIPRDLFSKIYQLIFLLENISLGNLLYLFTSSKDSKENTNSKKSYAENSWELN